MSENQKSKCESQKLHPQSNAERTQKYRERMTPEQKAKVNEKRRARHQKKREKLKTDLSEDLWGEQSAEPNNILYFRTNKLLAMQNTQAHRYISGFKIPNYIHDGHSKNYYYKIKTSSLCLRDCFGRSMWLGNEEIPSPTKLLKTLYRSTKFFHFEELTKDIADKCFEEKKNLPPSFNTQPDQEEASLFIEIEAAIQQRLITYGLQNASFLDMKDWLLINFKKPKQREIIKKYSILSKIDNKVIAQNKRILQHEMDLYRTDPLWSIKTQIESDVVAYWHIKGNQINEGTAANFLQIFPKLFRRFEGEEPENFLKKIIYKPMSILGNIEEDPEEINMETEGLAVFNTETPKRLKKKTGPPKHPLSLIYFTNESKENILRDKPTRLFIDGTRDKVPLKSFQMIAIHYKTNSGQSKTPFYILTNRFTTEVYSDIFGYINSIFPLNNIKVNIDFELPYRKALIQYGAKISYCYFHYSKIVYARARNYQKNVSAHQKMCKLLKKKVPVIDADVRTVIKNRLKILILIPPKLQKRYLKKFCKDIANNKAEKHVIRYIKEKFIKGTYSNDFYIEGCFDLTNNISEAFFSRFSRRFRRNPTPKEFMDNLILFECEQHYRVYNSLRQTNNPLCKFITTVQGKNFDFNDFEKLLMDVSNLKDDDCMTVESHTEGVIYRKMENKQKKYQSNKIRKTKQDKMTNQMILAERIKQTTTRIDDFLSDNRYNITDKKRVSTFYYDGINSCKNKFLKVIIAEALKGKSMAEYQFNARIDKLERELAALKNPNK
jgi:hypothetical protein